MIRDRKMRSIRNKKALSPVIAGIILIAVTVAVAIATATWLGSMTFSFTTIEELRITNCQWAQDISYADLTVNNFGTENVIIETVELNGDLTTNVVFVEGSASLDAGGTVIFRITESFSSSSRYDFTVITTKGTRADYISRAPSGNPTTPQYSVDFVLGTGGLSLSPGDGDYSGDIAISATADTDYVFNQWQSTGSITFDDAGSASTTATINGAGTITATFTYSPTLQVTFVSAGTADGSTGSPNNPTPSYPTGLQMNDLILLQVTVRDTSNTPSTPSGFTLLYGPDSTGTGRQWIYYKFSTGSESGTLSIHIPGSASAVARMYAFRNVALSSFNEGGGFGSGSSSTVNAQSVATSGDKRLAVSFVYVTDNNGLDSFSGETGGNWVEAVTEFQYNPSGGIDATIQLQTATMATTGTINGGNDNMSSSDSWGVRAFALIPG
jgi:FlaG/FlaF family flagellin (archaellin)